ncbi:MAG: hypothetical protein Q9218_006406 [Villophora microphyllina]
MPPEYMALEAKLDAWLNLSQREKARVFVMVRMRAMTMLTVSTRLIGLTPHAIKTCTPPANDFTRPTSILLFRTSIKNPPSPSPSRASSKKKNPKINSPTKLNQIGFCNLTTLTIANTTHSAGCAYNANQKNLLSVTFCAAAAPCDSILPLRSCDSKTQCESPVPVSTSFHQRRPTRRRPAMFLR